MACFFSKTIETPDRDFLFDKIKAEMSFSAIVALMEAEFDSAASQSTVQVELERLHLHTFMSENEITSTPTELSKVVDRINMVTPQAPSLFREEQHKIIHLSLAVISSPWAQPVLNQISTNNISFNRFVVAP